MIFAFILLPLSLGAPISASRGSTPSDRSAQAYSLSLTTFDPSGRLRQLEFAYAAVEQAWPAAACVCDDGIAVLSWFTAVPGATESCLHICRVTENIVLTYAGLKSDFRALSAKAQAIAIEYMRDLDTDPSVWYIADEMSAVMQKHTQMAGLRPFGASLLIAGLTNDRLELFSLEPSGWTAPFHTTAIGHDSRRIVTDLLRLHSRTIYDVVDALKDLPSEGDTSSEKKNSAAEPSRRCSLATISLGGRVRLYPDLQDFLTNHRNHAPPPPSPEETVQASAE